MELGNQRVLLTSPSRLWASLALDECLHLRNWRATKAGGRIEPAASRRDVGRVGARGKVTDQQRPLLRSIDIAIGAVLRGMADLRRRTPCE